MKKNTRFMNEVPLSPRRSPNKNQYNSRRNSICGGDREMYSKSISTLLDVNRDNTITSFLIIITDEQYKKKYFRSNSYYDNLKAKEYMFPGILDIVNIKDLKGNKEFIIKDQVIPLQLYIKLPRENIYVLSDKYYESYFLSQMNELIRIFTTLKAETIDIHIEQDRHTSSVININSGIHYTPFDLKAQYSDIKREQNKTVTIKNMVFKNNGKEIDINDFTLKKHFYYLPNQDDWQDIIRNRVKKCMVEDKYFYTYVNNVILSKELIAQLKVFNIGYRYNVENNKNIEINYNVSYFPLNKQKLMSSQSVCMSPNKNINDNCEEPNESYSSKDGFLYRLFRGILF